MIQCDCNIIIVSRIQLLANKSLFQIIYVSSILLLKNVILTGYQNVLHFGLTCSKSRVPPQTPLGELKTLPQTP